MALSVGSAFAGIGGFDLGFERAGMHTLWQVEQDPYCLAVLAKHFPAAQRFTDIRDVGAHNLARVDLFCGGFPCQDISLAGRGAGIDGERSGLWSEMFRVIRELEPRWIVVENVPALTSRGLDRVLRDLAEGGYDAEWDCIPASAVGAPHRRDRIWIVAYPQREGLEGLRAESGQPEVSESRDGGTLADPPRDAEARPAPPTGTERERAGPSGQRSGTGDVADSEVQRGARDGRRGAVDVQTDAEPRGGDARPVPASGGMRGGGGGGETPWAVEPNVGRVADGVPSRVDRLSALGNSLVPQIAEWIGWRIVEYEEDAA